MLPPKNLAACQFTACFLLVGCWSLSLVVEGYINIYWPWKQYGNKLLHPANPIQIKIQSPTHHCLLPALPTTSATNAAASADSNSPDSLYSPDSAWNTKAGTTDRASLLILRLLSCLLCWFCRWFYLIYSLIMCFRFYWCWLPASAAFHYVAGLNYAGRNTAAVLSSTSYSNPSNLTAAVIYLSYCLPPIGDWSGSLLISLHLLI